MEFRGYQESEMGCYMLEINSISKKRFMGLNISAFSLHIYKKV